VKTVKSPKCSTALVTTGEEFTTSACAKGIGGDAGRRRLKSEPKKTM
jgi:hypothetical protein